jgi:transposase
LKSRACSVWLWGVSAEQERRIVELEAENAALREVVAVQAATIARLEETVARLEARVVELERQLGRNSGNSSLPPSTDNAEARAVRAARRQAKREKGKRSPGKQPGDPGSHLARVDDPDRVVTHEPLACRGCGAGLGGAPVSGHERRQVFDLPERRREVTEHVAQKRRCGCGCETAAVFPREATAPAVWGLRVRAYALYLMNRQLIPVERTAEILADLLGAPVSTGWLAGLAAEAETALVPFMGDLADRLAAEPVVNVDETSARVAGVKWWVHVAGTALLTFLGMHRRRGVEATDDFGILARVSGTLVHDRWAPYWTYTQASHAICNAHILRDLAGVAEVHTQKPWATAMIELLVEAKRRAEAATAAGHDAVPRGQRSALRARYNRILADAFAANPDPPAGRKRNAVQKAGYNLAVALRDHATEILRFTTDLTVPFDNNLAERDLRMVKLQQKISGTFRTEPGARRFATTRSYIETGRKHGHNPIDLLIDLFNGHPWTIPTTPAT